MKTRSLPVALAAAALTLSACSDDDAPSQSKGPISEDRTAAFKPIIPEFAYMGRMVKDEEPCDVKRFRQAVTIFTENSKKPFTLFEPDPQGSDHTLPAIQIDTAAFKAEEEKFVVTVEEFNAATQAGKLEEVKAVYGETGAACKSCHNTFRGPE